MLFAMKRKIPDTIIKDETRRYKHTIIYNRTSTEDQNPENQLRDCESIRPKDQKTDTFIDYSLFEERQSAWRDSQRPEFDKIRKLIRLRKVKDLIVWDLDRLYRNRKKLVAFFEYCKIYKCTIHSFRQKWLEDINNIPEPFGEMVHRLMIDLMGYFGEDESNKKSDRVKAAVRRKKNITVSYKGNRWGRKPISTFKRNLIKELSKGNKTIRQIAEEVKLSKSVVHKTIQEFNS